MSKEEYAAYRQDYTEKELLLEKQIHALQMSQDEEEHHALESSWVTRLRELKEVKTLDRSIIVEMIDRIIIYNDRRIRIIYNFSDELEELFDRCLHIRN